MSCPETEETMVRRMLPRCNPHRQDRVQTWSIWQHEYGDGALRRFIRSKNHTFESDEDIFQSTMLTAFQEVERGRYEPRPGIPFTAYVKGIALNKIREAWRRKRSHVPLETVEFALTGPPGQRPEILYDQRERRTQLYNGIAALADDRRQVLERYMKGEKTAEIASALSMSEDNVRQHKSRGLRIIRQLVASQAPHAV